MKATSIFWTLGVLVIVFSSVKILAIAGGVKVGHVLGVLMFFWALVFHGRELSRKSSLFFLVYLALFAAVELVGSLGYRIVDLRYLGKHFIWVFYALLGCMYVSVVGAAQLERALKYAFVVIFICVVAKNLFYADTIQSMLFSGAAHPRPPWNFFNLGYNINTEVSWLCILSSLFAFRGRVWTILFAVCVLNMLISKVYGALLVSLMFATYMALYRLAGKVRFLVVILLTALLVVAFLGISREQFEEMGSGRSELWQLAITEFSAFSGVEWLIGKGFGSLYSLFHFHYELLDFHNILLDLTYEGGVIALSYFVILAGVPCLVFFRRANRYDLFTTRLYFLVVLVFANGMFSPRPLDLLFAFLVGSAFQLSASGNEKTV